MKMLRKIIIIGMILGLTAGFLFSKEYILEQWGAYIDIPQNWVPLEVTDSKATVADPAQRAFFQIKVSESSAWSTGEEIFEYLGNLLKADAEGEEFVYMGRDSVFSTLLFAVNDQPYQGFAVMINGVDYDWILLSYSEMEYFDAYQPFLVSALDSFSIDFAGLVQSGPVSTYYQDSFEEEDFFLLNFIFEDNSFSVEFDGNAMETSEILVEREVQVLANYTPEDHDAWSRFYRMIYRDNYKRMDGIFRQLLFSGLRRSTPPEETAARLLSWIQDFSYSRTGTPADFLPPLSALYNLSGDCDSLGLLYVLLLKHYGIDSILMVSSEYSHSMAAVDVRGNGARFPFMDKHYLVAEMTDKVGIGMIDASMADPEKWLGIGFN